MSLFLETLLLIWLPIRFKVFRFLFRISAPEITSVHLSVNLLFEKTSLSIWVSFIALQILTIPLSVILFEERSKLVTPVEAWDLISWQSCIEWLSVMFFDDRSMSPIWDCSLNDSLRLNLEGLPIPDFFRGWDTISVFSSSFWATQGKSASGSVAFRIWSSTKFCY